MTQLKSPSLSTLYLRVDEVEGLLAILQRFRQLFDPSFQLFLFFRRRLSFHSRNAPLQLRDLEILEIKFS